MNLVLCGFMGSGKTRVGKKLGKMLSMDFIDMDKYLERKLGMPILQFFSEKGEAAFRAEEAALVRDLANKGNAVIACGGGTVINEENVIQFHQGGGIIIFLDIPLIMAQERLKSDTKRPLLQRSDRTEYIQKLYMERKPIYRMAADFIVPAGDYAETVARRIIKCVGSNLLKKPTPQATKDSLNSKNKRAGRKRKWHHRGEKK